MSTDMAHPTIELAKPVVEHMLDKHYDLVLEHLLHHEVVLIECIPCYAAHGKAMRAAGESDA